MDADDLITLRSVTREYSGSFIALGPCDLNIRRGEFVTVVGASGSGKSTLLNLLGLLDRPTSGSYKFAGLEVTTMSDRARTGLRATNVGFVFQAFHLMDQRSAVENVMLATLYRGGKYSADRQEAARLLGLVGLADKCESTPSHFSGGERQRVAIARALAGNPSVVLCDEPTGNLDSRTSGGVLDLFYELNQAGTTIVLITHDPSVAARGSRTIEISDGQLREVSRFPDKE